jgi:hypothetical protein
VRVYSSALVTPGPFGPGWAYGMRVSASDAGATVRAEDGAEAFYRLDGTTYVRPAGVRSNLSRVGDGWQLVTPSQTTFGFDGQGRLVPVLNPRQVGVRLAYTATGLTITDPSGRMVTVTVSDGLIKKIDLPDQRYVSYGPEPADQERNLYEIINHDAAPSGAVSCCPVTAFAIRPCQLVPLSVLRYQNCRAHIDPTSVAPAVG